MSGLPTWAEIKAMDRYVVEMNKKRLGRVWPHNLKPRPSKRRVPVSQRPQPDHDHANPDAEA